MRLLSRFRQGELTWTEFDHDEIPPYAILSHTWGRDEISFLDLSDSRITQKNGYDKVRFCCEQAGRDGLKYCWVDSCCIDRRNSAEVTKAINSMFRWYHNAARCYVHLSDVLTNGIGVDLEDHRSIWEADFRKSRWFTRGWMLQEVLAPSHVEFYYLRHHRLGSKESLCPLIHDITRIPMDALRGRPLDTFSVDERLTWTRGRKTREPEDEVYCLLGISDIYLPLIYGEGKNSAQRRLWKELEGRFTTSAAQTTLFGDAKLDTQGLVVADPKP